jgi:hypothetical protein
VSWVIGFLSHKENGTMSKVRLTVALLGLALVAGTVFAADTLQSGPQVGQAVPGPFHPLNINGDNAGEKYCLFCKNGQNPVAMIFAREVSEPLTKLIKQIDAATEKNKGCSMGSFVVFLNDDESLKGKLKELAQKENLKQCILSIDNSAGPNGYSVSKDADVTVVLYTERKVKSNYAFKKGQMKDKDVQAIVADIRKILPQQ